MSNKSTKTNNHQADIKNSNKGTTGKNSTYQSAINNHANQLNPNNSNFKESKK